MTERAIKGSGHERRDVDVRLVTGFAAGLIVAAFVTCFAIAGLYQFFKVQHPSPDEASRIALHAQMLAPPPQLQTNPPADLVQFQAAEAKRLHGADGTHMPIERAMELVAQRGLPTRGSGTNNSSGLTPELLQQQKAAATAPTSP